MTEDTSNADDLAAPTDHDPSTRRRRADALRNADALLEAATTVFATSGVDAPAKEIADLAGVGVGTVYRHFPKRSSLVVAVMKHEIDACAAAGPALAEGHRPVAALTRWLRRFSSLLAAKRGLAGALHSEDSAFDELSAYFLRRLGPTLQALIDTAADAGEVRPRIEAKDLLYAIALLSQPVPHEDPGYHHRLVPCWSTGSWADSSEPDNLLRKAFPF